MSLQGTVTIRPFQDMRVTSTGISAGRRMSLLADSSEFARSIAERYSLRQTLWANAALKVRRRGAEGSVQSSQHHLHVNIMPRLNFTAINLCTLPPVPAEGKGHSWPVMEKIVLMRLGGVTPLLPTEDLLQGNLVRRLVTRGERVEEIVRQRRTKFLIHDAGEIARMPVPEQTISIGKPAQKVVRHAAGPKQIAEQAGAGERRPAGCPGPHFEPVPATLPQLPALDINRLTEQVIQAIDRRIIAQRERMGKV